MPTAERRWAGPLLGAFHLALATGCSNVHGSAVATSAAPAYSGAVRLSALDDPGGATQVGIVQASGTGKLEDLAEEFVAQVRKVGGNFGKVDAVRSRFEMVTQNQTYTYSCGSSSAPATCTGMRTVTSEVMTTQVLGRAFKLEAP